MSSCCRISRQAIIITVFIEYLIHQGYPADGSLLSGNPSSTANTPIIGNQQLQLLVCWNTEKSPGPDKTVPGKKKACSGKWSCDLWVRKCMSREPEA